MGAEVFPFCRHDPSALAYPTGYGIICCGFTSPGRKTSDMKKCIEDVTSLHLRLLRHPARRACRSASPDLLVRCFADCDGAAPQWRREGRYGRVSHRPQGRRRVCRNDHRRRDTVRLRRQLLHGCSDCDGDRQMRLTRSDGGSLDLRRLSCRDDGLQPDPSRQDGFRQACLQIDGKRFVAAHGARIGTS